MLLRTVPKTMTIKKNEGFVKNEFIKRELMKDDIHISIAGIEKIIQGNSSGLWEDAVVKRVHELNERQPID